MCLWYQKKLMLTERPRAAPATGKRYTREGHPRMVVRASRAC